MSSFKIIVIGVGGVGKSAIVLKFLRQKFVSDYDPTIEEEYRKDIIIDSKPRTIKIIDTAGQDDYVAIRDKHIRTGHGFIYVYSLIEIEETKHLVETVLRIRRIKEFDEDAEIPLIVLGNKFDLVESLGRASEELVGKRDYHCIETSAKTGLNIEKAFKEILRKAIIYKASSEADDLNDEFIKRKKCTLL